VPKGSESTKVRVLIPTTVGVVEVLLLAEEDPVIGRSVACIGGTTQVADIDAGYHAFVARPTGVVERLFGHACYRLDVSGRIDAGSSWQLGALAAHALHAAGRLAQEGDAAECTIWATGTVRSVDLSVGAVSHVQEKLGLSLDRLRAEIEAGRRVLVAVPAQNAADLTPELRGSLAALGIEVLEVGTVAPLLARLELSPGPDGVQEVPRSQRPAGGYVGRIAWRRPGTPWRQPLPWAAAAALLVVLLAGVALRAWWTAAEPEVAYYHAMVWRRGLPEGLGRLDAETRAHRVDSYRIARRRGRVVEIRLENSAGILRSDDDGHARWVVHYRESGEAEKLQVFRSNGQLIREERHEWSGGKLIVTFAHGGSLQAQAAMQLLAIDPFFRGTGSTGKSEITRHELTFDSDGLVSERRYQNAWGTPVKDAQGSFGQRLAYTPAGLVQRRAEIDADGNEITLKSGVLAVVSGYDRQDRLVRRTLVGADGRAFDGPDWYAYYVVEHDTWGNATATRYFGSNGKPALHRLGFAAISRRFDARGNLAEQANLGIDDRLVLYKNYARIVQSHDAFGNAVEETFLDADGKPTLHQDGYAKVTYRYDARGNIVEVSHFGIDGKPILEGRGYAKAVYRYDANNNVTDGQFFGIDGMAAATIWGIARISQATDARGNLTKMEAFGIDGKPAPYQEGIAKSVFVYDARGNRVEGAYFGVDGKPTLTKDGYASDAIAYDTRGNVVEVAYLGVDGKPTLNERGIAKYTVSYDTRGNAVEYAYFGVDGKPARGKDGYAKMAVTYDARGNHAAYAFFGVDGKATLDNSDSTAKNVYVRDARGNVVSEAHFDLDGMPTLHKEGYARAEYLYDARGNTVEYTYFGIDGKPTLTKGGYAKAKVSTDARGNLIEWSYFGVDGAPALLLPEGLAARIRAVRDRRGILVNVEYYGVDDRPTALAADVGELEPGALAYKIGFRPGDRVLAYRDQKITSAEHFGYLRQTPPFGDAAITLLRGSERLTLVAPPGQQLDLKLKNVAAASRTDER
jgi:hypothetical protein